MYSATIYSALVVALSAFVGAQNTTTGALGDAAVVKNNPLGVVYTATLPETRFFKASGLAGNVKGSVSAVANPDGVGVSFKVDFSNLPTSGGPFLYHIHVAPVPEDGNCTKTLAHLDPYVRGEDPVCDPAFPETCQVGDLNGKHGKITSDPFTATYSDNFASTLEGIGAFFGNRSIVVHYANKTRITCANFQLATGGNGTAPNATHTAAPPTFTGAAAKSMIPSFALLALVGLGLAL